MCTCVHVLSVLDGGCTCVCLLVRVCVCKGGTDVHVCAC